MPVIANTNWEAVIFMSVFVLSFSTFIALHIRAGLAEDAQWARQQLRAGHGIGLGLPAREQETTQRVATVVPSSSGRRVRVTTAAADLRLGDSDRGIPSLASAS